ncbi:aminoglycoside phosphotransferase family protein [uncultured Maribacter sp.]|uniref:phosphotransferase enzyme family protein n=1 Tax=uncultured Maribacter sp. TaxID=431308 RepID=UPI00260B8DB6|nr:aminoglycoside phosphotransferase family protein [uncultured Maribacter sp.]
MRKYSDKTLHAIVSHFIEGDKKYHFSPLTNGLINATFLVSDASTPICILQRINTNVFPNIDGLMQNITRAVHLLEHKEYAKIEFLKTEKNQTYLNTENGVWRVMTYLKDSIVYNTTTNTNIALEAGKIIGIFHYQLQKEYAKDYTDTIPDFHSLETRRKQFIQALETATAERKETAKEALAYTDTFFQVLAPLENPKLPARVCHNDTKLNNILFSTTNNKALCLIDLDTIMNGYFFYDFGDAIRTIVNTAPEDEKDHSKITFNKQLFTAFINGLKCHSGFLSSAELKTLPLGVIFMPFIHGLRALTDYLNGNIYYQVAYENQNLDRALSLFNFAKKALAEIDFITQEIMPLKQRLLPSS